MGYRIGTFGPGEFDQIQALSRSLGRQSNPSAFGEDECAVAAFDPTGRLVGWARSHYWEPQDPIAPSGYYLAGIEIAPEHQGRGLARQLSEARLIWVAERAGSAWCVVNATNSASLALQRSLGFVEVARAQKIGTVEFTGGSGVLFTKDLSDSQVVAAR